MMRAITPASVLVTRSAQLRPVTEVTSWLGARYLGQVPVAGGTDTRDLSVVGGQLELEVPRLPEWIPTTPTHPLNRFGQELLVRRGWATSEGEVTEWVSISRHLIRRSVPEGDVITVRADGVGERLVLDRFTDNFTVPAGSMFAQARRLADGTGLPVALASGVVARSAAARSWDRGAERAEAWSELLSAWPASTWIDPDSRTLVIRPPVPADGNPVLVLADGVGGSVVDTAPGGGPDDGAPNGVVASSAPEDGSVPISAIATIGTGPMRWGGPYGRRAAFISSPLLTTRAHVTSAARTRLNSLQAESWDLTVDIASCPAIEPGDIVRVTSGRDNTDVVGQVVSVRTALTPAAEPGQVAVRAIRGRLSGVVI